MDDRFRRDDGNKVKTLSFMLLFPRIFHSCLTTTYFPRFSSGNDLPRLFEKVSRIEKGKDETRDFVFLKNFLSKSLV